MIIGMGFVGLWKYRYAQTSNLRYVGEEPTTTSTTNWPPACLKPNETADFEIHKGSNVGTATIYVLDKTTSEEIRNFNIEGSEPGNPLSVQPHNCSVYVIRDFNIDLNKFKFLPGYRQEIWKYGYYGNGERLLTLASIDANGKENVPYALDFRIDPTETYLNLVRGYLGSSDYAIIVKDLKKLNDVFVLTLDDLVNKYGTHRGEIGTRTWIDENHFVGFVTEGPTVYDAVFVDKNGWKVSVFPTPEDAVAVNTWSPDYSWAVYNNGPGWIGIEEVAQQIYAEWRKEGRKKSLFAYNFFTKQKITLATVDDPGWDFKPKWLSDATLQYALPSGTTTTYTIPQ